MPASGTSVFGLPAYGTPSIVSPVTRAPASPFAGTTTEEARMRPASSETSRITMRRCLSVVLPMRSTAPLSG